MNEIIIPNAEVELVEGKIQFKNFELIKENVNKELALYDKLVVDETTKQKVKDTKAKLNKIKDSLDNERKAQEKIYNAPFEHFKGQVKEVVELIVNKSKELDEKIKSLEQIELNKKEKELRIYFKEMIEKYPQLDFIKFEHIGLKINLTNTVSKQIKEIEQYFMNVGDDIKIIQSHELKDRLMVKYLTNDFDIKKAQISLNNELEYEQRIKATKVIEKEVEVVKSVQKVDKIEELEEVSFTIKTSVEKIRELYKYLKENNIQIKGEDY